MTFGWLTWPLFTLAEMVCCRCMDEVPVPPDDAEFCGSPAQIEAMANAEPMVFECTVERANQSEWGVILDLWPEGLQVVGFTTEPQADGEVIVAPPEEGKDREVAGFNGSWWKNLVPGSGHSPTAPCEATSGTNSSRYHWATLTPWATSAPERDTEDASESVEVKRSVSRVSFALDEGADACEERTAAKALQGRLLCEKLRLHDFIASVDGNRDVKEMLQHLKYSTRARVTVLRPKRFTVNINRGEQSWGLDLAFHETASRCVRIQEITEGAVQNFNEEEASEGGMLEVRASDYIEYVNGTRGDAHSLIEQMSAAPCVTLSLLRVPPVPQLRQPSTQSSGRSALRGSR